MKTLADHIETSSLLNSFHEVGLILSDLNGNVISANRFVADGNLFDIPFEDNCSLPALFPAKRHELNGMIANLISGQVPFKFEYDRYDGGIKVHYQVWFRPVLDGNDAVCKILVEIRDVSPERFFFNKVRRIEEDHWKLIENANAIIIGVDSMGYITDWNELCEKTTGYTAREVFTKRLADMFGELPDSIDFATATENFELPVHTKDGRLRTLLINATPRTNQSGKIDGALLVGQDITELTEYRTSLEKKVEERTSELKESNEQIREQSRIIDQERKKSEALLLNILPEQVADELKKNGHVSPRYYPMATVLFADLVGFTVLGKGLDPKAMLDELSYIFTGFDLLVERNNLEKIKTMGDGYLAAGGVPNENTTNPIEAVNTAFEMISFVGRINEHNAKSNRPPWKVRIGIHTGELVAGVIGKNKFAYDVWGETVNVASRMESAGVAGKINISEITYNHIKHAFDCESRGSIAIKNMGSMNMYFVGDRKT